MSKAAHTAGVDWYERSDELWPEQIFVTNEREIVKLDRGVPGDGTDWYVADWSGKSWSYMDRRIHPGDLFQRFDDVNAAIAATKGGEV